MRVLHAIFIKVTPWLQFKNIKKIKTLHIFNIKKTHKISAIKQI